MSIFDFKSSLPLIKIDENFKKLSNSKSLFKIKSIMDMKNYTMKIERIND